MEGDKKLWVEEGGDGERRRIGWRSETRYYIVI